ncbi:MAG: DUF1292 domain-containing protein [Ignavibacteriales bacterium]
MNGDNVILSALPIVSVTYPDGKKYFFELAAKFEKDGNTFIALLPLKIRANREEEVEVLAFKVIKNTEGNNMLGDIKDEDEWNFVQSEWMKLKGELNSAG